MLKKDYLMDIIDDRGKLLTKILFHKEITDYVLPLDHSFGEIDHLHIQLIELLQQGEINEAENRLLEQIDPKDRKYLEVAIDFYVRLNRLDDKFLDAHMYSREEIKEGLEMVEKKYGICI